MTRAIAAGGLTPTKLINIESLEIASLGNTADFGDLTEAKALWARFQIELEVL